LTYHPTARNIADLPTAVVRKASIGSRRAVGSLDLGGSGEGTGRQRKNSDDELHC